MKPVQSLRSLAAKERELAAARENLAKAAADGPGVAADGAPGPGPGQGPPVRNLESAFQDSKVSGPGAVAVLRKAQSSVEKSAGSDAQRGGASARSGASPVRVAWRDPAKESRASILASWAAVYGLAESSSEKIKAHSKSAKVALISTASKKVRSGTPVKRSSGSSAGGGAGNGGGGSPRERALAMRGYERWAPELQLDYGRIGRDFRRQDAESGFWVAGRGEPSVYFPFV
ncbi:hypothetical protein AXG93_2415s1240 [Marchantia polymorpha subsp. ruderalis]|uniref:Uncharacterized protein n=1 Tax=Marchantia polymorpha subsp. ruderalis TaxID=1480154 RepID=A0A176VWL9_MARPO|nr:hypothetical protein AXG93_2415s1240 [Marchantia polymorpha subsp. ruderalis]